MAPNKRTDPTELMVVNDLPGEECRIAILQDGRLEELYSERTATATNVGNIYKGRVTNVEAAIQAAFVDYGKGVNGFLHISDLHPKYFPGRERTERVGKKIPRRHRPPIQEALRRGDEVLVQVLKEGIGTKGPTLTSYLSVPGRLLVMMPDMDRVGVSRKVEDEDKRREMRKILDSLDLPDGFGFILRTAGFGQPKTELKRDAAYLQRLWKVMDKRIETIKAPCELYTESDLLIRTIRDVLRPSIEAIVVDSESAYQRASGFLRVVAPRSAPKVTRYHSQNPIFHAFDVERQIELIHCREVPLPAGGKLVIDQTEALVAIDVNSGKSRTARDSESNAYNTNCEAVDEICRQLRLRDLGGLIINDLIDMRAAKNRAAIEERFAQNLKRDRARSTILPISEFGLVEMTRQRMRPSMRKSHFIACSHCDGRGEIKSPDSVGADTARHIGYLLQFSRVKRVEIVCSPRVASVLLSAKRRELVRLEDATSKKIDVRVSDAISVDRVDYYAYDERNADIDVAKLTPSSIPTIKELDAAAKKAAEGAPAAKPAAAARNGKQEQADTPATFALAAEALEDEEEAIASEAADGAPDRQKKRPRRRRRRGKGEPAAPEAKPSAETRTASAPVSPEPVRIFTLAKELGVKSRDIVERCKDEPDIDVKNHMSSVLGRAVAKIRSWFDGDSAPTTEAEAAPESPEPADAPSAPQGAPAQEGRSEQPARRKRRRRGGQKRSAQQAAKPQRSTEEPQSSSRAGQKPAAAPAQKNGAVEKSKEQPRGKRPRRGRRGRQPEADRKPQAARSEDTAATVSQAPASDASPKSESQSTTRKPRRSLYRSRAKPTAAARAQKEADADE